MIEPPFSLSPEALQSFGVAVARLAAELAAGMVAEHLRAASSPTYATAKNNPLGGPRAFLDAARRGEFQSHKVGREVRALWTDVDTYIQSRPGPRRRAERVTLEQELAASATPRKRGPKHG